MIPTLTELLCWPEGQAPWAKQEDGHQFSCDKQLAALLAEQRTGKTPIILGTAVRHYKRFLDEGGFKPGGTADKLGFNRIADLPKKQAKPGMRYRPSNWANKGFDAIVVIAMPSGVPRNWADEASLRLPEWTNHKSFVWNSQIADRVHYATAFKEFCLHEGLAVFLINGEALASPICHKAIGAFLRTRRAIVVGDETSLICSQPGNVRARVMEAIKKLPGTIARRILDGTPGDESPFDFFAQFSFLSRDIIGHRQYDTFKNMYGECEDQEVYVGGELKTFKKLKQDNNGRPIYKNLDHLASRLAPWSFRVKRADCFDVPSKLYQPYRFDLSKAQRDVYAPLRDEFEAWLRTGEKVSKAHVLARMTALDQIASNFFPGETLPTFCEACQGEGCDVCDGVGAIMKKGPTTVVDLDCDSRMVALEDVLSVNKEPGIIWCNFDLTVDKAMAMGERLGRKPVRYDGHVTPENKAAAKHHFQKGWAGLFIAKEASAGRGLDLSAAGWMCYAEASYSQRKRSQSEDRCEVAGRHAGTGIIDLMADDTLDDAKAAARAGKLDVAEYLMGKLRRAA